MPENRLSVQTLSVIIVNLDDPKVILVDGITLANMMIDHGLGTTTTATYEIRRMDSDYFTEE